MYDLKLNDAIIKADLVRKLLIEAYQAESVAKYKKATKKLNLAIKESIGILYLVNKVKSAPNKGREEAGQLVRPEIWSRSYSFNF